jgi:hypothetical protein
MTGVGSEFDGYADDDLHCYLAAKVPEDYSDDGFESDDDSDLIDRPMQVLPQLKTQVEEQNSGSPRKTVSFKSMLYMLTEFIEESRQCIIKPSSYRGDTVKFYHKIICSLIQTFSSKLISIRGKQIKLKYVNLLAKVAFAVRCVLKSLELPLFGGNASHFNIVLNAISEGVQMPGESERMMETVYIKPADFEAAQRLVFRQLGLKLKSKNQNFIAVFGRDCAACFNSIAECLMGNAG